MINFELLSLLKKIMTLNLFCYQGSIQPEDICNPPPLPPKCATFFFPEYESTALNMMWVTRIFCSDP